MQKYKRSWPVRTGALLFTLALMAAAASYTSYLIFSVAVVNLHETGEDRVASVAARIENHLNTAQSMHWVTADTVDFMARHGKTSGDILRYITEKTEKHALRFNEIDDNYGGLYGYIGGEYMDGFGWRPPAGYDTTALAWYKDAVKAGGESVVGPPYVDVYTRATVVSVSRMLSNGRDVMAFDMHMKRIQEMIESLRFKGKGYAFIVDQDDKIVAHQDITQNGRPMTETDEQRAFMARVKETESGHFEMVLNGQMKIAFVHRVMGRWRLVMILNDEELYTEVRGQLGTAVSVCLLLFILIALFSYLGYRNEWKYSRRMEEMRVEEQRQAYEARALKLERDAADQASRAKSSFLAEMSHEIRTPINAVLGMNEMILRESKDEAITAYARNAESAGRNLLAIINDILDFSKIEAGRMEIACAPYRLSSLLNDVCNMILFQAQSKDLAFDMEVDGTMPDALYGDEVRVRQVISNVLSNAVKYTDEGGVTLRAQGTREGDTLHLIVSVADTGVGIREEDIEKLFERFERSDAAQSKGAEGTGLGLAITQNLLRLMGGSIHVESEYGKGSVFTVAIPQRIVSDEPIGDFHRKFTQYAKDMAAPHESFRAPDARVLVTDDTEMNLTVICSLLRETGLQIDTASSGPGALALTKEAPYDLIFMDQRMPEMDGTETLRRIRGQEGGRNNETPVICLTADAVQGARERYLAEGFTDYLSKPVEAAAIEAALMKYLPPEKVVKITAPSEASLSDADGAGTGTGETGEGLSALGAFYAATDALDYDSALKYLMSEELLEKTLRQFYEKTAPNAAEIERLLSEGDYENYTIKVHALKSSARLVGADGLSEAARHLEACGNAVSRRG